MSRIFFFRRTIPGMAPHSRLPRAPNRNLNRGACAGTMKRAAVSCIDAIIALSACVTHSLTFDLISCPAVIETLPDFAYND